MKKSMKVLACLISTVMLGTMVTGCAKKDDPNEITIWSHYKDSDFKVIQQLADDWAKETKHKVKLVEQKDGFDPLVTASKGKTCPDAVVGVPNDKLGTFVTGGLIDELKSEVINESDYSKVAIDAGTLDGKKYGIPLTLETPVLFYNKDLVKTVPKTWDELINQAKTVGFNYPLKDFYYSAALIHGNGGYVFKNKDGKVDVNDIGLNSEGGVKGYEMINSLITSGIMNPSIDRDISLGNFKNGKTGFFYSGPWDVSALKKDNVNFGVATLPGIDGKPMPTLCGVKFAVVPTNSKKKDLAWDFMKYLAKNGPYKIFKQTAAIPALKSEQEKDEIKNDPITSVFVEQVNNSVPMLCNPEYGQVWGPANDNLASMTSGEETPKDAADNTVKQMKEKISVMK